MPPDPSQPTSTTRYSGLSGNEMYCVRILGYDPGNLVVGNSVYSMGYFGGIHTRVRTFTGGEVTPYTNMIAEGRKRSLDRFTQELQASGCSGASGVSSELIFHPGNVEFLSVGSGIHRRDGAQAQLFTSSSDGQELFCQWDAGYAPISFVFGNVAYSIGAARGLLGSIRQLAKGEVKQYSNVFNVTRNKALERISQEASSAGANSVIGIQTTIVPIGQPNSGVQEMVMIGTASYNEQVKDLAASLGGVITSDMTAEETWNVAKLGYAPIKLVLGTSVYSLGFVRGITAALKNYLKGEISELTQLIYGARQESLKKVQAQAQEVGADDVLGIKTYIYDLGGGLIEFLAIGTAVKRVNGVSTYSQQLPPQAIIHDKTTFVDNANVAYGVTLQSPTNTGFNR